MFQRKKRRQAGFIRKIDQSSNILSKQFHQVQHKLIREASCQFSPFKDFSCEPIEMIIETQRFQPKVLRESPFLTSRECNQYPFHWAKSVSLTRDPIIEQTVFHQQPKQKRKKSRKNTEKEQQLYTEQTLLFRKTKSYQNQNNFKDSRGFQNAESPTISESKFTTQNQEIYHIEKSAPIMEKEQPITLAQAFETKCKRMKDRLAAERQKFSKSLKKQHSKQQKQLKNQEKQEIIPFKPVKFDIPVPSRAKPPQHKHLRTSQDKQNIGDTYNRIQYNKKPKDKQTITFSTSFHETSQNNIKTHRPSTDNKSTSFYIPAPTSRSKPITQKEAYEHSLKKWKELPEVVAKEKQKQKQQELRERLCRVRAHSLQVRKKLRK